MNNIYVNVLKKDMYHNYSSLNNPCIPTNLSIEHNTNTCKKQQHIQKNTQLERNKPFIMHALKTSKHLECTNSRSIDV